MQRPPLGLGANSFSRGPSSPNGMGPRPQGAPMRQGQRPGPPPTLGQGVRRQAMVQPPGGIGIHRPTAPAARGGAHIALGNMFQDTPAFRGKTSYQCTGKREDGSMCGEPLIAGLGDYFLSGNDGPYCERCYSHTWGSHPIGNLQNQPHHQFGIRWKDHELEMLHGHINKFMDDVAQSTARAAGAPQGPDGRFWPNQMGLGRLPNEAEITQALSGFKFSVKCHGCSRNLKSDVNVVFTPTARDFAIPGVTPGVG